MTGQPLELILTKLLVRTPPCSQSDQISHFLRVKTQLKVCLISTQLWLELRVLSRLANLASVRLSTIQPWLVLSLRWTRLSNSFSLHLQLQYFSPLLTEVWVSQPPHGPSSPTWWRLWQKVLSTVALTLQMVWLMAHASHSVPAVVTATFGRSLHFKLVLTVPPIRTTSTFHFRHLLMTWAIHSMVHSARSLLSILIQVSPSRAISSLVPCSSSHSWESSLLTHR